VQTADDELAYLRERARQLEEALESRIVIEQAKGMLAARHGIDIPSAFEALRGAARSNRLKIHDLAHRVIVEPETPAEIARYLDDAAGDPGSRAS
jgi:AmiR/NasT family two-component response regulator